MQRRGSSGQPVKGQSAKRPKARNAPTAQVSTGDLQEQLDLRTRERDEALEQLAATSDVLQVISRSAFDLKSVLQTLVKSAARLCKADKAAITRQIGGEFFFRGLWFLAGIHRIRQNYPRKAGTWHGHRSNAAGRSGRSCSRCAGPAGSYLGQGPEARRLPYHARRSDVARRRPHRRSRIVALGSAAIH